MRNDVMHAVVLLALVQRPSTQLYMYLAQY